MSDTKISALPIASSVAAGDILPIVQGTGPSAATRRASVTQMRANVLAGRAISVEDFGALGNGSNNDGPAIQAAVNSLTGTGGTLLFAAKKYRIATPVLIDGEAIVLQGMGFTEGPTADDGTWFVIDTTGFTPFTFSGIKARGSAVRDIAFRQTHTAALNASWAPTNYDYVIRVQDCLGAVDFRNIFLCAINRGIFCDNSGRLNVERLRGQVFTTGIEIDRSLDIPRVNYVHFWTFLTSDINVMNYQQQNMDALLLRRVDGIFMDDIFVFAARSAFRFSSSTSGVTTKFYLGNGYTDFVKFSLWIEGNNVTGQIANLTTQGELLAPVGAPIPGGTGIRIDGASARVQIANLRIDAVESNAIQISNSNNRLDIFALRAERVNLGNTGAAVINLANVASGTPNQIYLGSPAVIANSNSAPLLNSGTNGFVALAAPAGTIANPGAMVGAIDTGLSLPVAGQLAVSAAGAEVMRLLPGTVTIGGASGAQALGVTTPAGTVNELRVTGAITGQPVAATAQGGDANVTLSLRSKGTGAVQIAPGNVLAFEAVNGGTLANYLRATAAPAGGRVSLQSLGSDANVSFDIIAKGTGVLGLQSNGNYAFVITNPVSAVNYIQATGAVTGTGPVITVTGTDANAALRLSAKGTAPVSALSPLQLPSFTVATLPAAASYARALIYVSDGTLNKRLAVSDGTSWRWPDGAVVS